MEHTTWIYNGKFIESINDLPTPDKWVGFCYKITNVRTGQTYIGKKNFWSKRKKALTKSELSTDKRLKKYKHVIKESDWLTYCGSSLPLQVDYKKPTAMFIREILHLACSKKQLSYYELKFMFEYDVLANPGSYNGNILGRFYAKDLACVEPE